MEVIDEAADKIVQVFDQQTPMQVRVTIILDSIGKDLALGEIFPRSIGFS